MAKVVSSVGISEDIVEYPLDGKLGRPRIALDDGKHLILYGNFALHNKKFIVEMNKKYSKYVDRAVEIQNNPEKMTEADNQDYIDMVRDLFPKFVLTSNAEDDLSVLFADKKLFPDNLIDKIGTFFVSSEPFENTLWTAEEVKKKVRRSPRKRNGKSNTKTR